MITASLWRLHNCEIPCRLQYMEADLQHDFSTGRPIGYD